MNKWHHLQVKRRREYNEALAVFTAATHHLKPGDKIADMPEKQRLHEACERMRQTWLPPKDGNMYGSLPDADHETEATP